MHHGWLFIRQTGFKTSIQPTELLLCVAISNILNVAMGNKYNNLLTMLNRSEDYQSLGNSNLVNCSSRNRYACRICSIFSNIAVLQIAKYWEDWRLITRQLTNYSQCLSSMGNIVFLRWESQVVTAFACTRRPRYDSPHGYYFLSPFVSLNCCNIAKNCVKPYSLFFIPEPIIYMIMSRFTSRYEFLNQLKFGYYTNNTKERLYASYSYGKSSMGRWLLRSRVPPLHVLKKAAEPSWDIVVCCSVCPWLQSLNKHIHCPDHNHWISIIIDCGDAGTMKLLFMCR